MDVGNGMDLYLIVHILSNASWPLDYENTMKYYENFSIAVPYLKLINSKVL